MNRNHPILVIIVSYNFERWLHRCLGSLRQSGQQADVLVVDNASQDQTTSLIETLYPEVRLIKSERNLGFGRANNIGLKIAIEEGYEAVFLLNQDAWIEAEVLAALWESARKYPAFGILSPVHLTGAGDKLEPGFRTYAQPCPPEEIKRSAGQSPVALPFINAAFWFIPTTVLKRVGGFCPLFYHYGEDVDYINRLHYHGFQVGYLPGIFGCHDREHRKSSREGWLRSEEVYLLSEYANINYGFVKALGYGVLAGVKKAWKSLWRKNVLTARDYMGITFRLLMRTFEVCRHRRINRTYHPSC